VIPVKVERTPHEVAPPHAPDGFVAERRAVTSPPGKAAMTDPHHSRPSFFPLLMTAVTLAALGAGCASAPEAEQADAAAEPAIVATSAPVREPATLLVSLSDGSIISQSIDVDADICMKANASPVTRCLSRGAPVYDSEGITVIGYRMEPTEIELVGR
jgi:hypothetical protein